MKSSAQTNVLAINFGGIGDEILFLPTLKSIRRALPNCRLTLMLEPRSRQVEQLTSLLDATVTFDIKKKPLYVADLIKLVGTIREGAYDLVISSGSSKVVSVLLFLGATEERIGYDSGSISRLLLTKSVRLNRQQYAAMMYHDLATALPGIDTLPAEQCLPLVEVPGRSLTAMAELLAEKPLGSGTTGGGKPRRVLLHPGTSRLAIEKGIIKTWPVESWLNLIDLLSKESNLEVLLAGGPDDDAIIKAILSGLPSTVALRNCYGKTKNLADLAALIQLSDVMVCVDSAPMHIGVGLRKRLVALFGPTDEKKLLPEDERFTALRQPGSTISGLQPTPAATGVQLQPDTVFRSVMDQLKAATSQESSLELSR